MHTHDGLNEPNDAIIPNITASARSPMRGNIAGNPAPHGDDPDRSVALVGAGPTSIYALQTLVAEALTPLRITVFEEQARAGLGTPYRPGWNDPAMLANIASIELPPLGQTLVEWLRDQPEWRLARYGIAPDGIEDRSFYPRVVLGLFFRDRFDALVTQGRALGHQIDVRSNTRVDDISADGDALCLTLTPRRGATQQMRFGHVLIATGHEWPDEPEVHPGFFASPWPASALKRIPAETVGIRGSSLSGIDAAVALAVQHGEFVIASGDDAGEPAPGQSTAATDQKLRWIANPGGALHISLMSRKGLLPEADFYFPIPHDPLTHFTETAVDALIAAEPDDLLDQTFALFWDELCACDPEYTAQFDADMDVERFAQGYFAARSDADAFAWAQANLIEARDNYATQTVVAWRYTILRAHETFARIVPHLDEDAYDRFVTELAPIFADNYATVPHASIERLLALHRAGVLEIVAVGDDCRLDTKSDATGARMRHAQWQRYFPWFIDATGQRPLAAADFPFPTLLEQGVVQDAQDTENGARGIAIDAQFRPLSDHRLAQQIHLLSVPFILGRHPFVQGLTSCYEMGEAAGRQIAAAACRDKGQGTDTA